MMMMMTTVSAVCVFKTPGRNYRIVHKELREESARTLNPTPTQNNVWYILRALIICIAHGSIIIMCIVNSNACIFTIIAA